jgi:lysyl-tRNA synthetase class II
MNYCWFIARIISNPVQTYFEENITLIEMIAEFRQIPSQIGYLKILFWTDNINKVENKQQYKINDYVLISGQSFITKKSEMEVSVTKLIPLFNGKIYSTR